MSDEPPKHQFHLLGSISNYHKYGYPSLKDEGGIIHVKNITHAEHVFYDEKFSETGIDGERIRTYIPPSLRNRIMYFMDTGKEAELFQLVKHILKGDQTNETDADIIARNPNFDDMPDVDPACSKLFPKISRSGFGYLFLWFCPVHGHSYGFHLSWWRGEERSLCFLVQVLCTHAQGYVL